MIYLSLASISCVHTGPFMTLENGIKEGLSKRWIRDFPEAPVVKTSLFNASGAGLTPGAKIEHTP